MTALSTPGNAGLYIHIPFCVKKCAYCDFYSISDLSLTAAFVDSLIHEMELMGSLPFTFDTIYLGGGTPSVLSAQAIGTMIAGAFALFHIQKDAEITMEVNPGTVNQDSMERYRRAGVNRINIGTQSFSTTTLQLLGRIHTVEDAVSAIVCTRKAGFDNVGLDLIYGIPGQTAAAWREDMKRAVDFTPEHLSCYILTYEKGTPLGKKRAEGLVEPLNDAAVADLFKTTQAFLGERGYEHYEIANFAKNTALSSTAGCAEAYRSRHNQKYWSLAPYIGLGPSAHSFVDPKRHWNHADIRTYISLIADDTLPIEEKETLTNEQRLMEAVYLKLRTIEGIDIPWLEKKYKVDFHDLFGSTLPYLIEKELLTVTTDRCALTPKGMRFLDGIVGMLV